MAFITKNDLRVLGEQHDGCCVSIFIPTYRAGVDVLKNRIRLKNQLKEAKAQLAGAGWEMRTPEIEAILEPAEQLLEDEHFWQQQSDGLAVFLAENFFRFDRLPLHFDEWVVVGPRFHVKPLLSLFSGDGRFYVLALSQNDVRLLQGTRYTVEEREYEGLPASMADALREEDPERQVQFHTSTSSPGTAGERAAIFYGHSPVQEEKEAILRYFYEVDKGLRPLLHQEQAPLVLAGVEYLFPLYQEANTYPHLIEPGIGGNPEDLKAETLHQKAWELVEPYITQARQGAIGRFYELITHKLASDDIHAIIPAAHYGQVDTLFVATDQHQWGSFDSQTGQITLAREQKPDTYDLLDETAVQTLLNSGTVYTSLAKDVPGGKGIAALFRYEPPAQTAA